jgi:hypothetical protein
MPRLLATELEEQHLGAADFEPGDHMDHAPADHAPASPSSNGLAVRSCSMLPQFG